MDTQALEDHDLTNTSDDPEVAYDQLAEFLLRAIPDDRKAQWAGKVMAYLASETKQAVSLGQVPPRIPTKAIHSDLKGNRNQEPSAWLSQIWKDIETRHYPEIEPSLIELCSQAGLRVYPALQKDDGKPAFYRLIAKPLQKTEYLQKAEVPEQFPGTLIYKRDLSLKLSWLGNLFFSQSLRWTPFRRISFLTWHVLLLVFATLLVLLLWLILWSRNEPLTGKDVVFIALGISIPWFAYRHLKGVVLLFEDRFMIAPEWMLAWKEFGATLEISRAKNPDAPKVLSVHRYSANCPVCGWMVKLDKGDPEFPSRIIGRCEENPREHVFSFDRSTKQGVPLRRLTCVSDTLRDRSFREECG